MANPFGFLYGEGQALAYIIEAVGKGLGLEETISAISSGGLSIASSKVEQVYNYLQNVVRPADEYIKYLQQFNYPNITRIPVAATKLLRNFSYQGQVQGISKLTGEIETRYMSLSTNALLTKQQAADIMGERAEGETGSGGLESAAVDITGIRQNPGGLVMP